MHKKSSFDTSEKGTGRDLAVRIFDGIMQADNEGEIRVEVPLQRTQETEIPDIHAVTFQANTLYNVTAVKKLAREAAHLLIVGLVERTDGSTFIGALQFEATDTPLVSSLIVQEIPQPPAA